MSSEWFCCRDGEKREGPFSDLQLQALVRSGALQPTDLVWKEGMAQRIAAGRVKGLFAAPVSKLRRTEAKPSAAGPTTTIRIGRGPENDVVLDYPMISYHHARIVVSGQELHIEDLNSSNGTAIGHPRHRIKQAALRKSDVVYFGSFRVPAAWLLRGHVALGREPYEAVKLAGAETVLGRDPACDHVLNNSMISWRHARLLRHAADTFLEDLGSCNGTFVNGRRIRGRVLVRPGDVISLGSFTLTLADAGELHKRDFRGNVSLEARGVAVDIPGRRLLNPVSLVIQPGELVGLMGPSGAGKTTLLSALNGYAPPSEGAILLNGQNLYACYRQFAPVIGYVPQDDIIHRDLTVFQALYYSARLRLPPDTTDAEIGTRLRAVLKQLGLENTANVLVGSPEKRGISGGQRKRVNLAMELLTEPQVLFLDEPTSGLSSEDAKVVMEHLRDLADQGKTILVTIHQPGLEIFRLLDNLVMLAKDRDGPANDPGRLAYYGPAFPDAIEFFNPGTTETSSSCAPDELFKGMGQRPAAAWEKEYLSSSYFQNYIALRAQPVSEAPSQADALAQPRPSFFLQWLTLVRRGLAIKMKDRFNSAILLFQAPVVAVLIVLVFGKQLGDAVTLENWPLISRALGTSLFLMTLSAVWFGASNAVREIVGEWAIYQRERMVALSIPAYVASKFTVLGALAVIQCLTLLGIAFPGCNLQSSAGLLFLLLLLAAFLGVTIGLILSALARTSEVAIALLPIVLLGMVILGGVMQPIHRMHPITQYLSAVNPARWCFEGMILLESGQRPTYEQMLPPNHPNASEPKDMAEHNFPRATHRTSVATCCGGLLLLFVLCAAASPIILRLRDRRSMTVSMGPGN